MKKKLMYFIVLIAGACSVYAFTVATSQTQSIAVSVLWDKTDTMLSNPNSTTIDALYNLKSNQWNGAYFSYASITDVDFNRRQDCTLEQASMWNGNELKRKKQVGAFFDSIDSIVKQSESIKAGKLHSSIYHTVMYELARLKSEPASSHTLLVYSDLQENSDLYNVYDPDMLQTLLYKRDKVKNVFEKSLQPPDLHGISVYILFEPKSQEDNRTFSAMSKIYKDILTEHGATVFIQSNL
jgi:hypothetical protein